MAFGTVWPFVYYLNLVTAFRLSPIAEAKLIDQLWLLLALAKRSQDCRSFTDRCWRLTIGCQHPAPSRDCQGPDPRPPKPACFPAARR
jgi:hypothetical protein